jgi:hypothetical protein
MLWYGAQFSRFDSRLGESRPQRASWWLLCLSRGGFEGGHAGTLAWSSFVSRLEGLADGGPWVAQRPVWLRPVSSGSHSVGNAPTVPGMAAQRRRWPHRARGDGGAVLSWPYVTASSWTGAESVVVCLSRVSPSSFEGCGMEEGWEWAV